MYGFLALEGDGNTVIGLKFYDHGETPGLGGEVDNPSWRQQWEGKKIYDEEGRPAARLVKGGVNPDSEASNYAVDSLSGATLTSRGVTNLIQYWTGEEGFAPFLTKLRAGEVKDGEA
jgi:Na+-transporting NADH:ubiquinone oxidoreductase subunit C